MNSTADQQNIQPASLTTFAQELHKWGANVVAIKRGTKHPLHDWKDLQARPQADHEVDGLPWNQAAAIGVINGPGGWRLFDIDAIKDKNGKVITPADERALVDLLVALGLPNDYQWSYRSGSGAGWGCVIRCDDERPGLSGDKGVYIGLPSPSYVFGQLELRWATGLTIIDGDHPTGPGYKWRRGERPFTPPAIVSAQQIESAFRRIAYQEGGRANGHNPTVAINSHYGAAAIGSAISIMETATPGARNNTLFAQTAALAELVNGGELARQEVERAMTGAAERAGLDESEIAATIASAFEKTRGKARSKPATAQQAPKATARAGFSADSAGADDPEAAPLDPKFKYGLEDTGNAERFAHRYRDNVRYDHTAGKWLVWAGSHWQPDANGAAQRLAKSTARAIYVESAAAAGRGDDDDAAAIAKWAKISSGEARRNAMLNLARAERPLAITRDQLNQNNNLLNCQNGTLDLATGKLRAHDRGDLLTYVLPVIYDPAATAPTWDTFIDRITDGDRELAAFLARAVGYTLGGDAGEQCLFFLYGFGANGKSTFIEIVMALLGDLGHKARAQVLMASERDRIPNEIAALAGKRLVVSSELSDGARLNEGLIKDLTGGDSMSARFLHQEAFTFRPTFRLWIYGNHKPVIAGTDDGIWRRIRLIPFSVQIPENERDPDLPGKLRAELAGILTWAIRGRQDYRRQGLNPPKVVTEATKEYRGDSDTMGLFIDDRCVTGPNFTATAGDLYTTYTTWAEANGLRAVSNVRFGRSLAERGLNKERDGMGRWVYIGIGILP